MYTPLRFQAAVAAGGLALMPFVLMQLTFPHVGKLITVDDVTRRGVDGGSAFLLAVMAAATLAHFALTIGAARGLAGWLGDRTSLARFVADPRSNSALFSPVIALGMTVNVLLGPVAFFLPSASPALPSLASWGAWAYAALWMVLAGLSVIVGKTWSSLKPSDLNFVWLLDVFAWAMLSLAGAGIAGTASAPGSARLAALLTAASIGIGLSLYSVKGGLLLKAQLSGRSLPADPVKPALFVVVPINCLFAIAIFKVSGHLGGALGARASTLNSAAVIGLFALASAWALLWVLALRRWFARGIPRPACYPSQWSLVCLFVGLEVLALYTHAFYFRSPVFIGFAYVSTAVAALLFGFLLAKFTGVYSSGPALAASAAGGRAT